ncbi:hypothetical protein [uncultured Mediterranean phage uvMED]|nr:hypothetical protein [uncultured Mediterranean phage uvMED]BAR19714.1 hypothetical protein [uncultured Mediterranean phage uvMED]
MPLIPLDLKAGFYRNGTDLDASNRWRDGSLVRWRDGSLRPIGGWQSMKSGFCANPIRGAHAWEDNGGTAYFAAGSYNELKAMTGAGTVYTITPSTMSAGREDAALNLGFGGGFYGTGYYGTQRPATGTYSEATSWSLDNFGQFLLGVHFDTGTLVEWQLGSSAVAAPVANAPINNLGLVVTEERFVFLLGAGGNPRRVAFSDKENNTVWTPAATNEAGDIDLQTTGQIMQGLKTRGQTLIITDSDAFAAKYIGPPYVYGFDRVGTSCGAVSRMSAVDTDMGAFWMGQKGFFTFDGNSIKELSCEVHDYVFDDINVNQQSKIWGFSNAEFSEVWWFYPSAGSLEIDRYVALDLLENHWLIGDLSRTGGVPRGVFRTPLMGGERAETITYDVTVANDSGNKYFLSGYSGSAPTISLKKGNTYIFDQSDATNSTHPIQFSTTSDGTHGGGSAYSSGVTSVGTAGSAGSYVQIVVSDSTPSTLYYYCVNHSGMGGTANVIEPVVIYNHEQGLNYDSGSVFCETGPISIGNGDQVAKVTEVIPDEKTQGDVDLKFKTRFYPNATETTHGPFNPSNPTSLRFTGRQMRMRVEGDQATNWRVGTMRLETKAGGRR